MFSTRQRAFVLCSFDEGLFCPAVLVLRNLDGKVVFLMGLLLAKSQSQWRFTLVVARCWLHAQNAPETTSSLLRQTKLFEKQVPGIEFCLCLKSE